MEPTLLAVHGEVSEEDESRLCLSPPGILSHCLRHFEFGRKKTILRHKRQSRGVFIWGKPKKEMEKKQFWGLDLPAATLPPGLFL